MCNIIVWNNWVTTNLIFWRKIITERNKIVGLGKTNLRLINSSMTQSGIQFQTNVTFFFFTTSTQHWNLMTLSCNVKLYLIFIAKVVIQIGCSIVLVIGHLIVSIFTVHPFLFCLKLHEEVFAKSWRHVLWFE